MDDGGEFGGQRDRSQGVSFADYKRVYLWAEPHKIVPFSNFPGSLKCLEFNLEDLGCFVQLDESVHLPCVIVEPRDEMRITCL